MNLPVDILHSSKTVFKPCGIGNFSRSLNDRLIELDIKSILWGDTLHPRMHLFGLVLIQHEYAFIKERDISLLSKLGIPVVFFVHSKPNRKFKIIDNIASGFIGMCKTMAPTNKPFFYWPHPGFYKEINREKARHSFEINGLKAKDYNKVVGTCGFANKARRFEMILPELCKHAREQNWLVIIHAPKHNKFESNQGHQSTVSVLEKLQERFSNNLVVQTEFLPFVQVNEILQVCDVVFCWTDTPSIPYASGVASDLYCSGTKLVICDKLQHSAVIGRENVVATEPDLFAFIDKLTREIMKEPTRHDGSDLSWRKSFIGIKEFLSEVIEHAKRKAGASPSNAGRLVSHSFIDRIAYGKSFYPNVS